MKKDILEKRVLCQLKIITSQMIQPLDEKYQRCYNCSGTDSGKYCYVQPYERRQYDKTKKEKKGC